jgi:hypothetical protein
MPFPTGGVGLNMLFAPLICTVGIQYMIAVIAGTLITRGYIKAMAQALWYRKTAASDDLTADTLNESPDGKILNRGLFISGVIGLMAMCGWSYPQLLCADRKERQVFEAYRKYCMLGELMCGGVDPIRLK